jgi:hypothetical protein
MIRRMKLMTGAVTTAAMLTFGALTLPPAAEAQQGQAGLVNVMVGDVIVAPNVNLAAAVMIAANICGVQVGVIARQGQGTVCHIEQDGEAVAVQIVRVRQR